MLVLNVQGIFCPNIIIYFQIANATKTAMIFSWEIRMKTEPEYVGEGGWRTGCGGVLVLLIR
jgi:hypothetical protein